jgi:hypothetical protein
VDESLAVVGGELDLDRFGGDERLRLERWTSEARRGALAPRGPADGVSYRADAPADGCDLLQISHPEYFQQEPTLQELLRQSQAVLRGTVVDRRSGFFAGEPAVLLEVEVEDVIRWPSGRSRPPTVYVRYGFGAVTFAGSTLCCRVQGFEPPPKTGDGVLVATFYELGSKSAPAVENSFVLSPLPQELTVQPRGRD